MPNYGRDGLPYTSLTVEVVPRISSAGHRPPINDHMGLPGGPVGSPLYRGGGQTLVH